MNTNLVRTSYCVFLAFVSFFSQAQPVPNFTSNQTGGCAPLVVSFTDLSTGNPTQWKWDLGNGTVSYLQNPSVTYLTPGTYTIKLVVQNAQGKDSLTRTNYINVYGKPEVDFSASVTTGCYPIAIQFNDLSSSTFGNNVQWEWDFGDGNTSTSQNPSHTYTAPGSYNISLRVTNIHGCTNTLTRQQYITIANPISASFTWNVPQGCNVSNTVTFQNNSTGSGALSFLWNFGDGTTSNLENPVHSFPSSGNYPVQLTVTSPAGCTSVYQVPGGIEIGTTSAMIGAPDTACINTPVSFINTSVPSPVSSAWNFGDGTISNEDHPVKGFTTPGNYIIRLITDFGGCYDTAYKTIHIASVPVALFTPSVTTSCTAPLTVGFSNQSSGAVQFEWLFGDGSSSTDQNPVHTYQTEGDFSVTLVAFNASGCSDTFELPGVIRIHGPEVSVDISPVEGCAPLQVQLSSSVTSVSPVVSYMWHSGNGTTSTQPSFFHTYLQGVYDISLIVVTADGCTDTIIRPAAIRAGIKPETAFSATPVRSCAYTPIQFTDITSGNPDRWLWEFGDGSTSSQQHPQHIYGDTGYFSIRLITWNNGCPDTVEIENYIYIDPPIARFSNSFNCEEPYKRIFTDESIGAHTWHWNFGDGNTSSLQNPVHLYASPGTYQVSLTVTNTITGCSFVEEEQVWIIDESAAFSSSGSEVCRNAPVTFVGQAAPGNLSSYNWDFGDGTTGFGHAATHTYAQAGTYDVRLIIIDQHGCADTLIKPSHITVNGPTAGFGIESPDHCMAATVSFSDSSLTDGIHPIESYLWDFGDGTTVNLPGGPFSHAYSSGGSYTVSLTVTDNSGCSDQVVHNGIVNVLQPVADFLADSVACLGSVIQFQNNSQGNSPSYQWNFGDGTTSTEISPQHMYSLAGVYSVQLILIDAAGCNDTLLLENHITISDPVASFVASDTFGTCPPLVVNFQNNSTGYESFHWDFGDGTASNALNPSHFYSVPGDFTAVLTVTAAGGCERTFQQNITVKGPSGSFSYNDLSGCSPHTVNFSASTQNNVSFIWDFSDGTTLPTLDSLTSHTYTATGTYLPRMILTDAAGCTVSIQGTDTITVDGISSIVNFDQQLYCGEANVQFNAQVNSTVPLASMTWNFGEGNTSTQNDPLHNYTSPGTYYPQLIVSNITGCTDTVTLTTPVVIHEKPVIGIADVLPGCAPLQATLQSVLIQNTGITQYEWNLGNGNILNGPTTGLQEFITSGDHPVYLAVTDTNGCKDTASAIIQVNPIPQVNAGNDGIVCAGSAVSLFASGASTYTWATDGSLSCTDCASPSASPSVNTTYYLTGTSAEGCSAMDSVSLTVVQPFNMTASTGDSICIGGTVRLEASGADQFHWYPSSGLNTTSGNNVMASPGNNIVYYVVGTDNEGCFRDTIEIPVRVFPVPEVEAGEDITINAGETIDLMPQISEDVINVTWTPTSSIFRSTYPAVTVKPRETTTYRIEVENAGGCRSSDQLTVHVICNDANVFIPNTFSPNGDGNNDVFYPRGSGLFRIRSFRVYNRWGELVFDKQNVEPNSYISGWDGTYKGKKLSPDVFVYIAEIICENNTIMPMKGNVALIR